MATYLYSILSAGADRMAVSDPHGWVLTLISVMVVFAALLLLYFLYSLSGFIFSGKSKRKSGAGEGGVDAQTAAAIAMALELETRQDVHDNESYVITISNKDNNWKFSKR